MDLVSYGSLLITGVGFWAHLFFSAFLGPNIRLKCVSVFDESRNVRWKVDPKKMMGIDPGLFFGGVHLGDEVSRWFVFFLSYATFDCDICRTLNTL